MTIRPRPRIALGFIVALLVVCTATVEAHHRIKYGHWVGYGWHVDLASEKVTSGIPGVERFWYAVVTNFTLLPGSVEACLEPNDVQPHEVPFYPFRIQVSNTATGDWRTVSPDLRLNCGADRMARQTIWPMRSFATDPISPAQTGGFRQGDWVRFVVYFTFDDRPGKRRVLASPPFQFTYEWMGLRTTLCELMSQPERFTGQLVHFEATVEKALEKSIAFDRSCGAEIWLDTLDSHDTLVLNFAYNEMQRLASDPKYAVTATVGGRFEHVSKAGGWSRHGFGHLNQWSSELVLKSVSVVVARPTDRPVQEKRK